MSSSLYELLGVERTADADTIKRAYRRKALTEHPDKGGDEEKFKKLNEAYNVLSDPQRRAVYDQTGEIPGESVASGAAGAGGPNVLTFWDPCLAADLAEWAAYRSLFFMEWDPQDRTVL